MINVSQIEPNIFIGNAPQSVVDVARIRKMGISAVLSLQSDEDFKVHGIDWLKVQDAYQNNNIQLYRFPIKDFSEVDLANKLPQPVKMLSSLITQRHRVYTHCNAGVCRAPATVLAYLCYCRGMTIQEGLRYIRQNRPYANPYLKAVEKALEQLNAADGLGV